MLYLYEELVDIESLTKDIMRNSKTLNLYNESEIDEMTYVFSCLSNYINELAKNNTINEIIGNREKLVELSRKEFVHVLDERNQFYSFTSEQKRSIQKVYNQLINEICESIVSDNIDLKEIILEHRKRLRNVFDKPVIEKPCEYYDARVQISILGIDVSKLLEPIIDVGCGKNAHMVEYFKEFRFDVIGIDRYCDVENESIKCMSWDDYFKRNYWGTIISHMAFSNHFIYHYLKNDAMDYRYAIKYKEMIDSLKDNGSFYYAPSVPFIEIYLNQREYKVEFMEIEKVGITHINKIY
jgi:hypothetical protein